MHTTFGKKNQCYHCGEDCLGLPVIFEEKSFCCEGCKTVYQLLHENGLCEYYQLNRNPGNSRRTELRSDKFTFLDDPSVRQRLISFEADRQVHVTFYLPVIHCSSCLWLLENLSHINSAVTRSTVNFPATQLDIVFNEDDTSLRKIAELLTNLGYEPYISLNDLGNQKTGISRNRIIQLGTAGFCFSNIMLFSFPEYLGIDSSDANLLFHTTSI